MRRLLLFILAVIAAGAAYWYVYPDRIPAWLQRVDLPAARDKTRLYKWENGDGQWMVTDRPPPGDRPYEVLEYRHDVNILPLPPELQEKQRQ